MQYQMYKDAINPKEKNALKKIILKSESEGMYKKIKPSLKNFIQQNVNSESIKKSKILSKDKKKKITEKSFKMNKFCLLKLDKNNFDKSLDEYYRQERNIRDIQVDILNNLKKFIESEQLYQAYEFSKQFHPDENPIKFIRQKLLDGCK